MAYSFSRYYLFLVLTCFTTSVFAQLNDITFANNVVSIGNVETAQIVIFDPSFETFNKYIIKLTLLREIDVNTLRKIEKETKKYYCEKFDSKKVLVEVTNWGKEDILEEKDISKSISNARIRAFYDYIFQRLESEELSSIEGIYESIAGGSGYEYRIVILKSTNDEGTFEAYLLGSSDPDLPISSTLLKLRPTAVPDKYLTQFWLKNGYTTSNQLTIYNEGMLNAGPKSYIKMYPSPNESRKYREINPLVDWDACGSGIILGPEGIVATNYHVIKSAKEIKIKLAVGENIREFKATLIAQDIPSDVALLRIDDTSSSFSELRPITLNDSIILGEEVMTLGYPIPDKMGENVKFNKGYVSALTGNDNRKDYFQTDLPVWYGNSGGPCFDQYGNLLGLVSEIRFDKGQKLENVCFVTNSNNLLSLIRATKYQQDISTKKSNQEAKMPELISRSVFIKVYF